jgi:putative ABC transport system permease protein
MVQTKALLGRAFLRGDDHPGAAPILVLGYNLWQERYAGVLGVKPKGFRFPKNVDLWMPLVPTPELANRNHRMLLGYSILRPGVTLHQANA